MSGGAASKKPIAPWSWYSKEKEPVREAVRDLYDRLSFDFSLVFHNGKALIYVLVEPSEGTMALLTRQDHLKGFILMSPVTAR